MLDNQANQRQRRAQSMPLRMQPRNQRDKPLRIPPSQRQPKGPSKMGKMWGNFRQGVSERFKRNDKKKETGNHKRQESLNTKAERYVISSMDDDLNDGGELNSAPPPPKQEL